MIIKTMSGIGQVYVHRFLLFVLLYVQTDARVFDFSTYYFFSRLKYDMAICFFFLTPLQSGYRQIYIYIYGR